MAKADDRVAVEFAKCAADAGYFVDAYGVIDDTQGHGDGLGTMPFRLWPAQVGVIWALMTCRLVMILKARQLGISWLCCGYALWLCLFQPGKTVLVYSQGQDEANEMLRRVKVLYERLPDWLRDAAPALARKPTTEEIAWVNGSRVKSLPATERAGRSLTASLVILDEAAHQVHADGLMTALKPTIDGGGQLVILSTANGIGNLFHRMWVKAAAGMNAFRTVFLPWWSRPARDAAWYDAQVAEADNPDKVKQEYPSTAQEAFLVSGRVRFQADWIDAQAANAREPIPASSLPDELRGVPGLRAYRIPAEADWGLRFLLSADVAEGIEGGDYSRGVLFDRHSGEEWASLHGTFEPDDFAVHLAAMAEHFDATIVVERNNHGHAVLSKLRTLCPARIARGHDGRDGWLTNVQTKPQAVDALAVALRDGLVTVRTAADLDELRIYAIGDNGRTAAPQGYHDDRVMSWAVGLGWLQLVGHHATGWGAAPIGPEWRG